MFVLTKLRIVDHNDKENINVSFYENHIKKVISNNFISLVIGENGVGKSFLLKSLVEIFVYLEKTKLFQRKPKYQYKKFNLEYYLNDDFYSINRNSGSELYCQKNYYSIEYKDLLLPSRVLAVSFMVNDKFIFSKNEENNIYRYLGVRTSTNSTYTSSIARNITFNLVNAVNSGLFNQIKDMLSLLKFDAYLEFETTENNKKKTEIIDFELSDEPPHLNKKIKIERGQMPAVFFKKDNDRITFDLCSSGEKHILFAFSGILSQIQDNSLILIDEPEISLHPEWQIQYVSTLDKLFSRYKNCLFIIASHSHYFVSDLKPDYSSIIAFRKNGKDSSSELIPYNTYAWSAENIIYNVFGIRTTRNYYFESDLNELLHLMENFSKKEEEKTKIANLLNKLRRYSLNDADPLLKVIEQAEGMIQ